MTFVNSRMDGNITTSIDKVLTTTAEGNNEYERGDYNVSVLGSRDHNDVFIQQPKSGYSGHAAVNPNYSKGNTSGATRLALVAHAVREMYFQTVEKLSYNKAHKKASRGAEVDISKIK